MSTHATPFELVVNSGTTSAQSPSETVDPVNILIVDDEPRNLAVLESILEGPKFRLIRAASGQEALLALMTHEFAVLVLDIQMPEMTGFELALMIKQRKKTARIPIIFLTAYYNDDQHMLEGYDSGAVDYLHKPVNPTVLRSKVAVFAELHRRGRALEQANDALLAEVDERRRAEAQLKELNETLDLRVTERTNALQASEALLRESNQRKDEFLATLAHELRNPLAPVRNAVYLLRQNPHATPELQWASELIDRQVQVMSRLIDDLMDVSRITQGKFELRPEWVEVRQIVAAAVESTQALIEEYGHQLVISVPNEKLFLQVDPTRLAQALMNLLNNAAKYMDRCGVIEMRAERFEEEVRFTVKDRGIGIDRDRLESVFELFSQVETALSRSRGGLGIGLSITQKLVEMHGGSVCARSQGVGHGSEFEVRIPISPDGPASKTAVPLPRSGPEQLAESSAGLRILVADDHEGAAASMAAFLELIGYDVMHVHDGQAAVLAAQAFHPQVVLLDIGMPILNGYEACKQIRAQAGGLAMKLIACTGWGQANDHKRSKEAGFDHHLVKPVDPAALAKLLAGIKETLGETTG